MRVAYHIQSHKNPEMVLRLVDRIRRSSDQETIVVVSHHHVEGPPLTLAQLEAGGEAMLFPSAGGYGDYSHIERYLESVRWLLEKDDPFDWFVNLSGQDYPIKPVRMMEEELAAADADAWLGFFDVFGPDSHWPRSRGATRYEFRHWRTSRLTPQWQRLLRPLGAVNRIQPWVRITVGYGAVGFRRTSIFGDDFRCFGGSFFGAVSREAAAYLAETERTRTDLASYYRTTLAPEESFIQAVLGNAGRFTIQPQARRYFDFSVNGGNHPKTLGVEDLPDMLASHAWFARKFDPHVDAAVLDELDRVNGWVQD